ncbi:MerR family transcriptional regulator [Thiohalorhabdus denitrificans]|uniref:DNA-binding transcriptional regulator, MerR family n=1 Tax=Thiohalorhabdus denitrificans TaxID=381306 RepID=A0A1G5GPF4_9GAMM|nr:MerR family transcriptional regulator [Thiohalorhabdus denitrificans]SCY53445.1 DNA-binding transcriptional regulator, MerR family [Thiohalorhabdus denitrificans]
MDPLKERHMTPRRQHWKIGEVAEQLGTTTRTLRFYEEQGLLRPARTDRGTRLYSDRDRQRARLILELAGLGISLEEIRALVAAREASGTGDEAGHKVHDLLGRLHGEAAALKARCEALMGEIEAADRLVRRCYDCPRPPTATGCPECPARKGQEDAELLKLVWQEQADP